MEGKGEGVSVKVVRCGESWDAGVPARCLPHGFAPGAWEGDISEGRKPGPLRRGVQSPSVRTG